MKKHDIQRQLTFSYNIQVISKKKFINQTVRDKMIFTENVGLVFKVVDQDLNAL